MLIKESVSECLAKELRLPEGERLSMICRLSWLATITLEFGFRCRRDSREEGKQWLFALLQQIDPPKTINIQWDGFDQFFNDGEDELVPADTIALLFEGCALIAEERITKERLLNWLETAWDTGVRQQEIYSMEVEGSVMNEVGIILNFGTMLVIRGVSDGYLPEMLA